MLGMMSMCLMIRSRLVVTAFDDDLSETGKGLRSKEMRYMQKECNRVTRLKRGKYQALSGPQARYSIQWRE